MGAIMGLMGVSLSLSGEASSLQIVNSFSFQVSRLSRSVLPWDLEMQESMKEFFVTARNRFHVDADRMK